MNRKTVIVTGGYGFIGSRFVKTLIEETPYNVVIVDKNTYAADKSRVTSWFDIKKHAGRLTHYIADIADPHLVEKTGDAFKQAAYVVNFAGETHVDNSIENGKPFIDSNYNGVFNLLEICRSSKKLIKFIQISTDEVYGDMTELRGFQSANEGFKLKPSSYYSATKAGADMLVEACARTYGFNYLITRTCNNFGPGQHPEKYLPKIMECIGQDVEVPVYGDGSQVREWIHTDDNAKIIEALMSSESAVNQVYNIGSGTHHTNKEVLEIVGRLMEKNVKFKEVPDRLGHDRRYSLDCKKLDRFYGNWTPTCFEGFLKDEVRELLTR
tara:strand:+ start:642 stop:1616 length:975 start_codon:yes stop_codon:yes gene_type:complete